MYEELMPVRIAIFASGAGTNAREIIKYFHEAKHLVRGRPVEIALILCNRPGAGVFDVAADAGIPSLLIEKEKFFRGNHYLAELKNVDITFIVLAGFLWKVPVPVIRAFPNHILNIHPALLPDFGGKGMYGDAVHKAVLASGARVSGITIHYVDEQYDHGRMFFQANFNIQPGETVESLAQKIHALEYKYYPEQIARWIESKLSLNP